MSQGEVTIICVGGDTTLDDEIEKVTHGTVSHIAGELFGGFIYESTGLKEESDPYPGVWLHRRKKYEGNPYATFITVQIPDMESLENAAINLLGTPYGYPDCFKTVIYETLKIDIPDTDKTAHCSETWTRLLRAGGLNILPDLEPGSVSPQRLMEALIGIQNG